MTEISLATSSRVRPDRAHQQVAERAAGRLARDRVTRHDRHRDRQEHRQHQGQRGRRVELAVLQHGGQERAALAGRRGQVGDRDEDRHHERQRAGQHHADPGARPPEQLHQLDPDHENASRSGPLVRAGAGHREHDLLERALVRADRADPQPRRHQPRVERGRVLRALGADQQPVAVPLLHLPVEQRDRPVGVRGVHHDPAGRRAQRGQVVLQDQAPGVQHPDPGAQLLHLGHQVAGQEDRHPRLVQPDEELAQVPDPVRVQAVARLVQHQQPRPADQRAGQAQPLPHAQRVGLDRPAVHPAQADLLQRLVDAAPPGAPGRPPARTGRVEQREVRPAGQVRVGGGLLDQRADLRQHLARVPGHPPAEHLDLAAGGVDQAEQHADQRGLARAVRPEQAVPVALAHLEVDRAHRGHRAVALGQRPGPDHARGQPASVTTASPARPGRSPPARAGRR